MGTTQQPRQPVQAQRGDLRFRESSGELRIHPQMQQSDEGPAGQQGRLPGGVRRLDAEQDVAAGHDRVRVADGGSRLQVARVVEPGTGTRAGFDGHRVTEFEESCDTIGGQGHTPFPWRGLPEHSDGRARCRCRRGLHRW